MKIERVNSEIAKILREVIGEDIKDPRVSECKMLTIMSVDTSADLGVALVFVSVMDGDPEAVIEGLNAAKGYLRNALFKRMKIRTVPELKFLLDTSVDYGFKIDKILQQLKKEEASD